MIIARCVYRTINTDLTSIIHRFLLRQQFNNRRRRSKLAISISRGQRSRAINAINAINAAQSMRQSLHNNYKPKESKPKSYRIVIGQLGIKLGYTQRNLEIQLKGRVIASNR